MRQDRISPARKTSDADDPCDPWCRVARSTVVDCAQAACRDCSRATERGGARACRPRCVRIFSITGCSRITGNDLQLAAAVRAVLQVERKHPLEQPGPTQPHRPVMRAARLALGRWRGLGGRLGLLRHHHRAQLGVGDQHAVEANQVQPRAWHQRGQTLHELQRAHDQVRGAVAPGGLQLQHHLTGSVGLYALVGQCRAVWRGRDRVAIRSARERT